MPWGEQMARYPSEMEEHWEAHGERLLIRPIRPEDAPQHEALFHRLLPEEIRLRFFSALRELSRAQLAKFTQIDYQRDMALIAVREATGETVGVGRLAREADPRVAEFAVLVRHDLQGLGIATHLLQRLVDWASCHGIREMVGQILAENTTMIDLARHLGFQTQHLRGAPEIVEARLRLAGPEA